MTILISKTGYWRKPELRMRTDVIQEKNKILVRKTALGNKSIFILKETVKNYHNIKREVSSKINLVKILKQEKNSLEFEFCPGQTIEFLIEQNLIEKNFEKAEKYYRLGLEIIESLPSNQTKIRDQKKYFDFFNLDLKIINKKEEFLKHPFLELTADHVFIYNKKNYLIDYEFFLDFPIPKKFLIFNYQFNLLNSLNQVITSLASEKFPLISFMNNLFIPQSWQKYSLLSSQEQIHYLKHREKIQNYLNWEKVDYSRFLGGIPINLNYRGFPKLTRGLIEQIYNHEKNYINPLQKNLDLKQREIEGLQKTLLQIKSAKFFRFWQSYCNQRDKIKQKVKRLLNR